MAKRKRPRQLATKLLFVSRPGNHVTSIQKARSSKSSDLPQRRASICCRSSGNIISRQNFREKFRTKRKGFPKKSMHANSRDAKICGKNRSEEHTSELQSREK